MKIICNRCDGNITLFLGILEDERVFFDFTGPDGFQLQLILDPEEAAVIGTQLIEDHEAPLCTHGSPGVLQ